MVLTDSFSLDTLVYLPASIKVEKIHPTKELLEQCDNAIYRKDICDCLNNAFSTSFVPSNKNVVLHGMSGVADMLVVHDVGNYVYCPGALKFAGGPPVLFIKITVDYTK